MRRFGIYLNVICIALLCGGCMAYHSGEVRVLEAYPPMSFKQATTPKMISTEVQYQLVGMLANDQIRKGMVDNIEAKAQNIFRQSNYFSYAEDKKTADYVLLMNVKNNAEPNKTLHLLSGLSLGLLPAIARDNFTIECELRDRSGKKLGERRIKQTLASVTHLFMVFAFPFATFDGAATDMWDQVLKDVSVWAHDTLEKKKGG